MLSLLQKLIRALLSPVLKLLGLGFDPAVNPMRHLGALTIFFCWIVLVSGIWLFIFFRTSVTGAYESVEYLTHNQWYIGGVMRSLHRYASDAAIITLVLHIVKEFAFDRYRDKRWFSWITGLPLIWLLIPLGITGYWLVWDNLGHYVALASAELLDWLPVFTDSMARNFLSDESLSNRFFTLMAFLHLIGLPLFLVLGIWLHVFRINGPEINPPRLLMASTLLAMLVLSIIFPALSQGEANLEVVPQSLGLDWFYLLIYPLIQAWPLGWVWTLLLGISLLIVFAPWLPPAKSNAAAVVDLDNCNGCQRCVDDCPFGAVSMVPRSDGKAYAQEAVVEPDLCTSCGLCVGACPTATPFRTRSELIPGINLPGLSVAKLREDVKKASARLQGDQRVLVFSCECDPVKLAASDPRQASVTVSCMAHVPPSFVDFVLSRKLAEGVLFAGCSGGDCRYRFGTDWTTRRINRQRDPHLRKRIDNSCVALAWEQPWSQYRDPGEALSAFRNTLTPGEATAAGTPRPGWIPRFTRPVAMISAFAIFLVVTGVFSVWPQIRLIEPGNAVVSLTFSHAGQRIRECRTLSQEELQKLPPNMRNPRDCPRERLPIQVFFSIDGEPLYEDTLMPSGIWNDGESVVYQRLAIEAGSRRLFIGMSDSARETGFDYQYEELLKIEPRQHIVVDFDDVEQTFRFR